MEEFQWLKEAVEVISIVGGWSFFLFSFILNVLFLYMLASKKSTLKLDELSVKLKIFEAKFKNDNNVEIKNLKDEIRALREDISSLKKEKFSLTLAFMILILLMTISRIFSRKSKVDTELERDKILEKENAKGREDESGEESFFDISKQSEAIKLKNSIDR